MTDKTGGPAFPRPGDFHPQFGMTMRDYFAAKAMQGFCGNPMNRDALPKEISRAAYMMADVMLKAREQ